PALVADPGACTPLRPRGPFDQDFSSDCSETKCDVGKGSRVQIRLMPLAEAPPLQRSIGQPLLAVAALAFSRQATLTFAALACQRLIALRAVPGFGNLQRREGAKERGRARVPEVFRWFGWGRPYRDPSAHDIENQGRSEPPAGTPGPVALSGRA